MKRNILTVGIIVLMIVSAGFWSVSPAGRIRATHEYVISKYYQFISIDKEGIYQWIEPEYNYLDTIELFIANIYPETEGDIELTLCNADGERIFSKAFAASSIPAGEFFSYKIGKKIEEGERYFIHIAYSGNVNDLEKVPQLMISERNKNLLETQEAIVRGEILEHNVAITYHYAQKQLFRV